jgi:nucleotide-binding universal stress UspA family protein
MPDRSTARRMVIAVDGFAASEAAVTWAAPDAALRKLTITLLHVNSSPVASFLPAESRRYAAMTRRDREAGEILEEAAAIVADIAGGNASAVGREVHTGHPVAVDGSANSERAVELAFEEAQLRGVTLVAVHAASDQSVLSRTDVDRPAASSAGAETLRNVLSPWQRRHPGVEVEAVVRSVDVPVIVARPPI